MDIKKYQSWVKKNGSPNYTLEVALLGIVGEVGELSDVIKKNTIYGSYDFGMPYKEKLIDEAGDVMWQLINLLNIMGISIETLLEYNYTKLLKRHGSLKTAADGGKR